MYVNERVPLIQVPPDRYLINYSKDISDTPYVAPVRVVGPVRLAAMLFFLAYGGSYGVEGSLATGPPFYLLLSFLIAPFVWAVPEALITAELSSAIPTRGGNIAWAKVAFGNLLSWQSGFWALLALPSFVASFPPMFVGSLQDLIGMTFTFWQSALIHLGIVIFITTLNIFGTKTVSGGNIVFTLLVLGPFVVLLGYGFANGVLSRDLITDKSWSGTIHWRTMVTTAIWSCGGWTNGGQIAGEIANPRKSFSIAVLLVLCLTLAFSLLPLAIAYGVQPDQAHWTQFSVGSWVRVAYLLGGEWFRIFMGIGALISALGEMNASFCAQSRMLSYLSASDDFMFPRWFAPESTRFQTPYVAVLALAVFSFGVSLLPFQQIMNYVVLLSSISLLISFACLIKLRISHPEMSRPFKIPFGIVGLVYVCIVGVAICIFNIAIASSLAQIVGAGMVVVGLILYYLVFWIKKKLKP